MMVAVGLGANLTQLHTGLAVTGPSRDVAWGYYIAQLTLLVLVAACAALFTGTWFDKGLGRVSGRFIPTPLHGFLDYFPTTIELLIGETVGMLLTGLQSHEVDHVHHSYLQMGHVLAYEIHRRQSLHRRYISRTTHHHVWPGTLVVAGPLPDADARATVAYG